MQDHPDATEEEFDAAFDAYCAANRTIDQIVPVQTYDESWYLAGLSVREDHGLDVAVAYVNPDLPAYDDDALWTLSWGLGQQFVPQRDCETDATIWNDTDPNPNDDDPDSCVADDKRDLTIFANAPTTDHSVHAIGNSTIKQRFDYHHHRADQPTLGHRAEHALRVENFRYDDQDYLGYLSTTETPRILAKFRPQRRSRRSSIARGALPRRRAGGRDRDGQRCVHGGPEHRGLPGGDLDGAAMGALPLPATRRRRGRPTRRPSTGMRWGWTWRTASKSMYPD